MAGELLIDKLCPAAQSPSQQNKFVPVVRNSSITFTIHIHLTHQLHHQTNMSFFKKLKASLTDDKPKEEKKEEKKAEAKPVDTSHDVSTDAVALLGLSSVLT